MSTPISKLTKPQQSILAGSVLGAACVLAGFLSRAWWLPKAHQLPNSLGPSASEGAEQHGDQPGGDPAGGAATSLTLSEQAKKNVGLKLMTVELSTYEPPITIPGTIVDRPGRTELEVSAPMTGIVTRIYPIRGEAVEPGQPASPGQGAKPGGALFDLRLTHEDLVTTQREFLRTLEEVDVIEKEIARIEGVISSGVVAGKRQWELEYEHNKTQAGCDALEKALLLHGLSPRQVEQIKVTRELISEVTVHAPPLAEEPPDGGERPWLQVASIDVKPGQRVELLLPVERWENRIVLPIDTVIREGPERFVFRQNGNHFERVAVHVEYSDHRYAVLGNTADLFPGTVVVASGAYQMHLALKNATSGGGKEEHVGCSH